MLWPLQLQDDHLDRIFLKKIEKKIKQHSSRILPVIIMILIPAAWHFAMESGTVGLGGSNKETIPKSLNPDKGKLTF